MLEGASTFAFVASRRHQTDVQGMASFPFTVYASSSGWGGVECADEAEARAEFWAPLWPRQRAIPRLKPCSEKGVSLHRDEWPEMVLILRGQFQLWV